MQKSRPSGAADKGSSGPCAVLCAELRTGICTYLNYVHMQSLNGGYVPRPMRPGKRPTGIVPVGEGARLQIADQERCNSTALRKATRRVSQLYDVALAPCGLRSTQRSILIHIARAGAPSVGELAVALVLDRSALAHNLKPLERDGFVAIDVGAADKRSRTIRLTKRGEAKLRESTKLWQTAQDQFEQAFGADRAAALRETLALVASIDFEETPSAVGKRSRKPRSRTTT